MRPVQLFTTGPEDPRSFVVEGTIPSFNEAPQVIFWGERVFVFVRSTKESCKGRMTDIWQYREAFAVALIQTRTKGGDPA